MVTRGFVGRRPRAEVAHRTPPGQHETTDFPVLSIGPTPMVDVSTWSLAVKVEGDVAGRFDWEQFTALETSSARYDIHCVTRWSKFDTHWSGVRIDTILQAVGLKDVPPHLSAISADGYSSNLLTKDLRGSCAMVATHFGGEALDRHHGGPARLLVPKLYFWKSAKWLRVLDFRASETKGFWETRGYHVYGDPWKEERFDGE